MNGQTAQAEKYCHQCGTMQPEHNFCRSRGRLTSPCHACRRKQERSWRTLNPRIKGLRGAGVAPYTGLDPETPTDAPPGSPAKIAVLEQRAAQGFGLWHELDRQQEFVEPAVEEGTDFNDDLD
jgi:hypothetical protein